MKVIVLYPENKHLIDDALVRNQNDFGSVNCSYNLRVSGIRGLGSNPETRLVLELE